jgi:hypothetical protein
VVALQAQDAVEEKILSLAEKTVVAKRRWVATEEQCECLVHELTLLSLRSYELCMPITDIPSPPPYMRGCVLRWPNTPRWPCGYPRFSRWCSGHPVDTRALAH